MMPLCRYYRVMSLDKNRVHLWTIFQHSRRFIRKFIYTWRNNGTLRPAKRHKFINRSPIYSSKSKSPARDNRVCFSPQHFSNKSDIDENRRCSTEYTALSLSRDRLGRLVFTSVKPAAYYEEWAPGWCKRARARARAQYADSLGSRPPPPLVFRTSNPGRCLRVP